MANMCDAMWLEYIYLQLYIAFQISTLAHMLNIIIGINRNS